MAFHACKVHNTFSFYCFDKMIFQKGFLSCFGTFFECVETSKLQTRVQMVECSVFKIHGIFAMILHHQRMEDVIKVIATAVNQRTPIAIKRIESKMTFRHVSWKEMSVLRIQNVARKLVIQTLVLVSDLETFRSRSRR